MYAKVDEEVLDELREVVGDDGVVAGEDQLEPYSHDETPQLVFRPEVAVRPRDSSEVSRIVTLANSRRIPLTPRGGGTGLSGGALPVFGGILLSFERMNRIKEIDTMNLMAVVEPGVITADLESEVANCGLFYPPDPVSSDSCTLGGNVAECAGGPRAVKYGVTRDYVQGLEVVFPDGNIAKLGGKLLKDVTGYSLLDIIVGSEGTLAVVTQAVLRLLPLPGHKVDLLIPFDNVQTAIETLSGVMRTGIIPSTMELMEGKSLKVCEAYLKREIPFSDAAIHILVQLDGNRREDVTREYEIVGELVLDKGALDVMVAEDKSTQERVWEPRKNLGDALKESGNLFVRDDLVVPPSQIPTLIDEVRRIEDKYKVDIHCFGHVGDGNIHVDIEGDSPPGEKTELIHDLYEVTLKLGGSITAEHGIGFVKKSWLAMGLAQPEIDLMKRIKASFDPNNILNPGKIFE
jgi:glycolate oxidase